LFGGNRPLQYTRSSVIGTPQRGYKTLNGKVCKFPFIYKGKYYDKCIGKPGKDWCSVSPNYDIYRTYGKGCRKIKTTDGNANGADCVFPFIYKKKNYQKCIFDEKKQEYWCGTTTYFDTDKKYGICKLKGIV
jgi:hypothetical protein